MKLWDKGFTTEKIIEQFTVGNDRILDEALAIHDVKGNLAHAQMLAKIGILNQVELEGLVMALNEIRIEIEEGKFQIEEGFEDVHSKIEFELVKRVGQAGKKIHTARSRNDQVLVDLHLFVKTEIQEIKKLILGIFDQLMQLSDEHKEQIMPGYTHLQVAMPSSFGLWFGAFAETLIDDVILFNAALKISDQNPLGSAAGYGSSFPIDRVLTTELLDFEFLKVNSIAAQLSRGRLEKSLAFALASLAGTVAKFSDDVCLFMSQNFQFVSFPKELTTGSSIMPHKKNPDVFELLRAKSNSIQAVPNELMLLTSNLSSGYHRDFQLLKERLFWAVTSTKENLKVWLYMLEHIEINKECAENNMYDYMYTVDSLNERVMNGQNFREAYRSLGKEVEDGTYIPNKSLKHTHIGSIGNLGNDQIINKMKLIYQSN